MTDINDLTKTALEQMIQSAVSALEKEHGVDDLNVVPGWQGLLIDRVQADAGATFHGYDSASDVIAEISQLAAHKALGALDVAAVGGVGLALARGGGGRVALCGRIIDALNVQQAQCQVSAVLLAAGRRQ